MDNCIQPYISKYLYQHALVLFLELDKYGAIVDLNPYAQTVLGDCVNDLFSDVVVDFSNGDSFGTRLEKWTVDPPKEWLISISTKNGEPSSFLFTFSKVDEHILVLGRTDHHELAAMGQEIYALNQQLGNLSRELQKKNATLEDALAHVKTLQGILPICMHCHKIRDEKDVWDRMESYIESRTQAEFSHSICETCLDKYYPEEDDDDDNDAPVPNSFDGTN